MSSDQFFTDRNGEKVMTDEMCKRLELSPLVGSYILAMLRIKSHRLGNMVDMALVAKLIKYVSLHKGELKRQFHRDGYSTDDVRQAYQNKANFTFLK